MRFFLVLSIREDTVDDILEGKLKNLKGISESKQVIIQFFGEARNAFFTFSEEEIKKYNKVTKVKYVVSELLRNDMKVLKRVFNQYHKFGRERVIQNLCDYIFPFISDKTLKYDWKYYGYSSKISYLERDFAGSIDSVTDLQDYINASLETLGSSGKVTRKEVALGVNQVKKIYADEKEWLIDSDTFNIPPNSHLVIGIPKQRLALYEKYTKGELTDIDNFMHKDVIEKTKSLLDIVKKLSKKYKVKIISTDKFIAVRNSLLKQREEMHSSLSYVSIF